MSHGRFLVPNAARSTGRLRGAAALAALALLLAGCGSSSAPAGQMLDDGQPGLSGAGGNLAENGDHEHRLPQTGLPPLPGGNPPATTPTPQPAAPPQPAAAPGQPAQSGQAAEDPARAMGAEPLLDAGGFDPAPQGGSEANHNSQGGDIATLGPAHN